MLWMIDNQKGRRNLASIDKIALARKREEILKPAAEANEKGGLTLGQNCPRVHTRKEAAKQAGVGERTYDAGKLILDAAENDEIPEGKVQELRERKTSIHRVANDIKKARKKKERQEARKEAVTAAPLPEGLIVGDFRDAEIPAGSLPLIFTDPPYDRKASKMLPDLADFAERSLMDGGSLILYVGQTQIPTAIEALSAKLRYWWTIACVHSGRSTVMREYGINAGWKAVLWFVKGSRFDDSIMVDDVMSGGEEKSHHDWQQSKSEAEYWIEKLTEKGDPVCDPFLGGGTTAAAAKAKGRKWIGIEIDEETAQIAAQRINDTAV